MDIQKLIGDLVAKLTGNKDLIAKFTADPLKKPAVLSAKF